MKNKIKIYKREEGFDRKRKRGRDRGHT
jgi:hypothetical protein